MAREKRCVIITAIIFLLFVGICNAEPDSKVKYLMDEPVSMFDFGLFRLEMLFREHLIGDYESEVSYNWDRNLIEIKNEPGTTEILKNKNEAKNWCKLYISSVRAVMTLPQYDFFFTHYGYARKNRPENLYNHFRKIIEISTLVLYKGGSVKAKAPLIGEEIYFYEPKRR